MVDICHSRQVSGRHCSRSDISTWVFGSVRVGLLADMGHGAKVGVTVCVCSLTHSTHTHTLTHIHTLTHCTQCTHCTHTLTHTEYRTWDQSGSHCVCAHSHTLHTLIHSHPHSHTHTLYTMYTHSHTHTLTHTLTHSHTHILYTHTHTY